ncbi:MAG: hypothetical protein ACMUIS_03535 [bacterium]
MVRQLMVFLISLSVVFVFPAVSRAGNTATHTVTVKVEPINEIALTGGDVTLLVTPDVSDPDSLGTKDDTSCDLVWTSNRDDQKITIASDLHSPKFPLKAEARNVNGGAPAPETTLSTASNDFVTGISRTTGRCDVSYMVDVPEADEQGCDTHTVTYTLSDS